MVLIFIIIFYFVGRLNELVWQGGGLRGCGSFHVNTGSSLNSKNLRNTISP